MSDPLGLSEGVKGLSSGLDSAREASKSVSKQIENVQKDAVDVAQQRAQERIRARREAEFKKERALIKALDEWKRKKQISDEEAELKIKFVRQYGAKEWEA
jgi:translation initiation factor 2 alpha subunit (eIF-2alpha)